MKCRVPAHTLEVSTEIKRSRFLACVAPAQSADDAHAFIQTQRTEHPDANHVCWAFVAGVPGHTTALGCSDDGEPSGTAGKPMLNVLMHGDIGFVVATTVRYFGGTKLGTGGLVRAYTQSLVAALDTLDTIPWRARSALNITFPYAFESTARHLAQSVDADIETVHYTDAVHMELLLDSTARTPLIETLQNASGGTVEVVEP